MTAQALSVAQAIELIPLNKLVASPRNVRRKNRKADIEPLAGSIAARGLLQNLCVTPAEDGRFEVEAGGRRLLALKHLARTGAIARDHLVPCHVGAREEGREVSLTENVHRVGMDAMDEVDAYGQLVAEGATPDEVARRFGVTRRHVDQRLALSGLAPRIKAAWKRGDVSLEAARAFCLVEDHARQEAVFRSLGRPVTHAASVRARLMEGRMRASDRLAVFVGLEVYEQAGGAVVRDLFDEEAVYIEDPALMAKLAEEKLQGACETHLAEGWGWVEIDLGASRIHAAGSTRLTPHWRDMTPEEQAEHDRLQAEIDALDDALEADSVEDDPRWETRDDLAARIETLVQARRSYDPELMALAGVVLSVDHEGRACASPGAVRREDEKAIREIRKRRQAEAEGAEGQATAGGKGAHPREQPSEPESALPKNVIRDLSLARTLAIRLKLARDSGAALAVAVAAMSVGSQFRSSLSGIDVAANPARVDDLDALAELRGALEADLPADEHDALAWAFGQTRETLLSALAVLVAAAVDLTHEKGTSADRRRQALTDQLAMALDLDMRAFWQADADYWSRLPKGELLKALADAPAVMELPAGQREALIRAHAKLRKDELAAKVGEAFAGAGYLPDLLVTPVSAGDIGLTETGAAAVAGE